MKAQPQKKLSKIQARTFLDMDWQTGAFSRRADFRFILPYQFLLLCKLSDVTPQQVLLDFMETLSHGSWKRKGRDTARALLVGYFTVQGYGQAVYRVEEIQELFKELDAIGQLFPEDAEPALMDLHVKWREAYHRYFYQKWSRRFPQKL